VSHLIILLGVAAVLALLIWVGRGKSRQDRQLRVAAGVSSLLLLVVAGFMLLHGNIPFGALTGVVGAGLAYVARGVPNPFVRQGPGDARMSEAEARSLLGIGDTAGPEEITAAHRRMMGRVHPDHGGAAGLAAQVNAARDRLLGKR
jgi:hypothetical protein